MPPYGVPLKGGIAVSASRSGFSLPRFDTSSGREPSKTVRVSPGSEPEMWNTPMQSSSSAIT